MYICIIYKLTDETRLISSQILVQRRDEYASDPDLQLKIEIFEVYLLIR